jgi:hypothetical protein
LLRKWRCGANVAGEEALKAKDRGLLEDIRAKATGSAAIEVERLIGMLPGGRK